MSIVDDWKKPDGSLHMRAYYYSFEETRYVPVDRILSAVACAGKSFHHTEGWSEDYRDGVSYADLIQQEATACADAAADMARKLVKYERVVEALKEREWRTASDAAFVNGQLDALDAEDGQ